MNSLSLVSQAGSIRLREGLEAILVIATLAAILRRAGAATELRAIYPGAGPGAADDDRSEAVAMLLASVLML
jgi:high-affinity Fe2+/Pb2+ permease